MDDDNEKTITIQGQLDVSDELCSDGTAALSVILENGEEYVINNRKTVKRLQKMAYNQETLVFTGTIKQDSTGLNVLVVQSCAKPQPVPVKQSSRTRKTAQSKRRSPK